MKGLNEKIVSIRCSNEILLKDIVSIGGSNEISLIETHTSTIYGLIIDPHNNQLPVGLIAQLVEHCTGIAEVRVLVPFRSFIRYYSSSII